MSLIKSAISWYSENVPITRGRGRLQALGLRMMGLREAIAYSNDGAAFQLHFPEDTWCSNIFYCGTWERGTLDVMKRLIRPQDTVLDIGANIGWFTVHAAKLLTEGYCHSFEPMPRTFCKLAENCAMNHVTGRVILNQVALGDRDGACELYEFDGLVHGCNSLSKLGRTDCHAVQVAMTTLNRYLAEKQVRRVDLIKVDIEGAEMLLLKGAGHLFDMADRPFWIIELNVDTSRSFGYSPRDLLELLHVRSECEFYLIEGAWGKVRPLDSLENYKNGDKCVCVPKERAAQWRMAFS
jgi:FkbM family methyltransferase